MEAKVQESIEVPEPPLTDAGVRVHAVLLADNATVPGNPPEGVTVIVEVPAVFTVAVTAVGFEVSVKPAGGFTVKATVAVWVRDPLVPVTVTVTDPVDVNVQDRVEVPEPPVTVAGVREQAALLPVMPTLPLKLFSGEIVIVEVAAEPTEVVTLAGLALIWKSGTATV